MGEQANKLCLSGHSLGGGLAQYAGCKNQVKTFAFNGASIHFRNRLRLGRDLIEAAKDNIICINLEDEFLSKHLECPGSRIMPVYQLGRELKIKPRKKKHKNLNPFKRHSVIPIEDVLREYEDVL
ncbi:MAG: hypothetical protein A2007_04675 [Verrucomicrobia bacterium GWC2_42_7]|nr:MAG: hypothetical protein A2007_04675 [Verrucomicrobia bacterium GWC2_42_7]